MKTKSCPNCNKDRLAEEMKSLGNSIRCVYCIDKAMSFDQLRVERAKATLRACEELAEAAIVEDVCDDVQAGYALERVKESVFHKWGYRAES